MSVNENIQAQNIPVDINYDDPNALRKLIEVAKQTLQRINEHEERLREVENIVNN